MIRCFDVSITERLYYTNAYTREFDATVVRVDQIEGRPAVILDRTAFYPSSGGQPHDTGTLAGARVLDVLDRDDGDIAHVLERPLQPGAVRGVIDWDRRFEHMQQHTGQHVLSAAFDRSLSARTVSFHLGSERSTIDLDRDLTPAQIASAEAEANRVVWDDRVVDVRFVDEDEAVALPLRKEPRRSGRLRVVSVEECDLSACGGTHVARTGAIGLIAVSGFEKYKGGVRIEFVCGGRALRDFRTLREIVAGSIRQLSVLPGELPDALGRLQTEAKELQRTIRGLQERLAAFEARAARSRAVRIGPFQVVLETSGWEAAGLKALAAAIVAEPGCAAVVFNPASGLIVVARSPDVAVDASAILKTLTAAFGGRGGGRPELAQAGGLSGTAADVLAAAGGRIEDAVRKPE
jgi:alanyl-tRNA synthetase